MKPSLIPLLLLSSCNIDRPIGSIPDLSIPPDMTCVPLAAPKIDLLFMIDNSNGMGATRDELRDRFAELIKPFQDLADTGTPIDLHLGVVTSDYGAGATGAPGCQPSPGGEQGRLQAIGSASPNTCKPPLAANFIHYDFANPNLANLPIGQDLVATFTCMASTGENGCGFEHQLESVYAALHNGIPENAGFLRPDALLAVIFVTDEDDCSAPPDSDVFDKNKTATYGYESSYRCPHFGIVCDGKPLPYTELSHSSSGLQTNCAPDPAGKLYDVKRYIDFFTLPKSLGGVKDDPSHVALVAIDGPSTPVEVLLSNPGTPGGTPYPKCSQLNEASNPPCVPVMQHSCQNPQLPVFLADPAVRLNTVVNAARFHRITSICDADYSNAIAGIADLLRFATLCR